MSKHLDKRQLETDRWSPTPVGSVFMDTTQGWEVSQICNYIKYIFLILFSKQYITTIYLHVNYTELGISNLETI